MAVVLRKGLISVLLLALAFGAAAQRRVSADAEVKTLTDGKVTTVTKRVFCQGNGRLVTVFKKPVEYTALTNLKGEMKMYLPSSNEVITQMRDEFSSRSEYLYIFLSGRSDDLGLTALGYTLQSSAYDEEGYLKRTYTTKKQDLAPVVELVLKDYLPIYLAYMNTSGKILSKTYLSSYDKSSAFVFPRRITDISYIPEKNDSTVVRTIYSNIELNGSAPEFDFQVPSDAKSVNKSAFGK